MCSNQYLSKEDTEKVLAVFDRDERIGFEEGKFTCLACKGRGQDLVPGCIGVKLEDCQKCHGSGSIHFRIVVPS